MPRPLPGHIRDATGGEAQAVRAHILDSAFRVISANGLAGASTRAIATEADLSTGTLYNYFDNRLRLLAQALIRRIHILAGPLGDLPERAGQGTVAANLRYFARHIGTTLDEVVPLGAAAFSDPELLAAMREEFAAGHSAGETTGSAIGILNRYLIAEQKHGRVGAEADCLAAASIIFGVCHDHAFHRFLHGGARSPVALDREIDFVADALAVE